MGSEELKLTFDLGEIEASQETLNHGCARSFLGQELDSSAVKRAKDHIAWIRRSKSLGLREVQGLAQT